jgi:hypothetical protein
MHSSRDAFKLWIGVGTEVSADRLQTKPSANDWQDINGFRSTAYKKMVAELLKQDETLTRASSYIHNHPLRYLTLALHWKSTGGLRLEES